MAWQESVADNTIWRQGQSRNKM